jgi:hypothetical protein
VCRAKDSSTRQVTRLVEVRERGRFYFRPLLLLEEDLTVRGLHSAIVQLFEASRHTPLWAEITPRCAPLVSPKPFFFLLVVWAIQYGHICTFLRVSGVWLERAVRRVVLNGFILPSFCESDSAPVCRYLRPDYFNDGHLHIHIVYPHDSSQREAMYGSRGLVTDEQVKKEVDQGGLNGRCPQLEVVFI